MQICKNREAVMGELGENIKKFRTEANLHQEELATKLGKSKNVISNWERGDNRPDADMIKKICEIFGIEPNQLYGWESAKPHTIAAHFDGEDFTEEEMAEIMQFAAFVKSRKKK